MVRFGVRKTSCNFNLVPRVPALIFGICKCSPVQHDAIGLAIAHC